MNGWGLGSIAEWSEARTRSASGENPDGRPGGGARAELGSHSTAYASRRLPKGWKKSPCHDLAPGETYTVLDAEGPGVIQHIWCTVLPQHLRSIVLRIHWDGAAEPSVAVPLGDFFCQGWARYAPVTSMPVAVAPAGGLNSYWPMPFRSRCTITVENLTENTIEGFFHQITWSEEPVAERASYLHACWRRSNPLDAQSPHVIVDGIVAGHAAGDPARSLQRCAIALRAVSLARDGSHPVQDRIVGQRAGPGFQRRRGRSAAVLPAARRHRLDRLLVCRCTRRLTQC